MSLPISASSKYGFGALYGPSSNYSIKGLGMKIGSLEKSTGTKVETVRYYEGIGLMPEPERTSANHLSYTPAHRDRLNFIRHARGLGFDIGDVRSLLDLAD